MIRCRNVVTAKSPFAFDHTTKRLPLEGGDREGNLSRLNRNRHSTLPSNAQRSELKSGHATAAERLSSTALRSNKPDYSRETPFLEIRQCPSGCMPRGSNIAFPLTAFHQKCSISAVAPAGQLGEALFTVIGSVLTRTRRNPMGHAFPAMCRAHARLNDVLRVCALPLITDGWQISGVTQARPSTRRFNVSGLSGEGNRQFRGQS